MASRYLFASPFTKTRDMHEFGVDPDGEETGSHGLVTWYIYIYIYYDLISALQYE
jgi:hypothetical protein